MKLRHAQPSCLAVNLLDHSCATFALAQTNELVWLPDKLQDHQGISAIGPDFVLILLDSEHSIGIKLAYLLASSVECV